MTLRPYQLRAIESLRDCRKRGVRRILLSAPTGSGKTVIGCEVIAGLRERGKRALVIAHRKELLDQFYLRLEDRRIVAGMIRADDTRTDPLLPVQLASIQSLIRRDLPPADLVIVDEAHRCPGDSYARVLEAYPKAPVIGLTATPCRLDGRPLREHFDELVVAATYSELIESGAILAPMVYAPHATVDLSKVRRVAGDYNEGQVQMVMNRPHVVGNLVEEWQKHAQGRSTVVFAVGIEHSKSIEARFKEAGVRVAHLDGSTPEDDRAQILLDLEVGNLEVVTNVGVLCEGWDQPRVKCCIMARPTLSLTLYMQCVGRILRPCGDQQPVVLDHAGNAERHGLPHEDREWTLDGRIRRLSEAKHRVCPACYAYVTKNPCEACGHQTERKAREVREDPSGVLARIDANIAKERESDPRRAYFDKQVDRARTLGFKPGFASAKYKEKFGEWPPWSWSQAVKASVDDEWREQMAKRERDRAFWQSKNAEKLQALEAALPEAVEESETFSVEDL